MIAHRLNRTKVELKQYCIINVDANNQGLNRTKVELKHGCADSS